MTPPRPPQSQYSLAREVALRLERAGEQPYASEEEQYLVLENGEVIEFGRPLKGHRMFPAKTLLKNRRLAEGFAEFAAKGNISDCVFWSICTPTSKTEVDELEQDYESFNKLINSVFTDLRKNFGFELLAFGVHIEFDESSKMFDIHGHFVARIPSAQREAARRKLMQAFSRSHTPDEKIRSPQGVIYYLSRTFSLKKMLRWPVPALVAAWKLGDRRFHFCRTAGDFQKYRREQKKVSDSSRVRRRRQIIRGERQSREDRARRDRPLTSRVWKIRGEQIRGTLYQRASLAGTRLGSSAIQSQPPSPRSSNLGAYPSASWATTQTGALASTSRFGVVVPTINAFGTGTSVNPIHVRRPKKSLRRAIQFVVNFVKRLIGKVRRNE
jgi:hypothetical protein